MARISSSAITSGHRLMFSFSSLAIVRVTLKRTGWLLCRGLELGDWCRRRVSDEESALPAFGELRGGD